MLRKQLLHEAKMQNKFLHMILQESQKTSKLIENLHKKMCDMDKKMEDLV